MMQNALSTTTHIGTKIKSDGEGKTNVLSLAFLKIGQNSDNDRISIQHRTVENPMPHSSLFFSGLPQEY